MVSRRDVVAGEDRLPQARTLLEAWTIDHVPVLSCHLHSQPVYPYQWAVVWRRRLRRRLRLMENIVAIPFSAPITPSLRELPHLYKCPLYPPIPKASSTRKRLALKSTIRQEADLIVATTPAETGLSPAQPLVWRPPKPIAIIVRTVPEKIV